jgi:hypothetical protein
MTDLEKTLTERVRIQDRNLYSIAQAVFTSVGVEVLKTIFGQYIDCDTRAEIVREFCSTCGEHKVDCTC